MKRCLPLMLCFFLLCGCFSPTEADEKRTPEFMSGIWLTYSEVDGLLEGGGLESRFEQVLENCEKKELTDIFIAVRPFCDSLYRSRLFPLDPLAGEYDFDILKYIIERAHKRDIRIHAWLNPYRVAGQPTGPDTLPEKSPVKALKQDEDYIVYNGIYLNPASRAVIKLVTDGVREICNGYDIDGIHFDDYFYPTADAGFDRLSYESYCDACESPLSLEDFRRANVNSLISSVYTAIKFTSKDIIFSVSPCASIEKNRDEYYADVGAWCENGCVDIIIPQLYFGFAYPDESYRFEKLLTDWKKLLKDTGVDLAVGLASYKVNTDIQPDADEWKDGDEIITRQTELCLGDAMIKGVVYFSYSYVFT